MFIIVGIIFILFTSLQILIYIDMYSSKVSLTEQYYNIYQITNMVFKPFLLLETFVHEVSHLNSAIISGNRANSIQLNSDGSGLAIYGVKENASTFTRSFIVLSGYIGSSIFSVIVAYLVYYKQFDIVMWLLTILILYTLIFYMRSLFGVIWSILVGTILIYSLKTGNSDRIQNFVQFLSVILLFSSLRSVITIFFLSFNSEADSGDAEQLEELTKINRKFWGTLFLLLGIYMFYVGVSIVYFDNVHWELLSNIVVKIMEFRA